MSDLLAQSLLVVACIAAAVVWLPWFSMPLSREFGMSLCALALIPLADSIRVGRSVSAYVPIMILIGLGLILLSYRRARTARNTGDPHVIESVDLREVSGGRKS
jgi:uncharacterized membrane protein